ncbi:MAG: exodeoxyribonuclease I [Candidatus Saccharibacteria bacterium]|nr:exodeoxyribonuclease I [Candidatus Saccharibacteria bacterium]
MNYFFYDLETSGLSAKYDRIMQFAGQRTDENFTEVGEPVNLLVRLEEDTLPSPSAIMVTKITPQKTHLDGITEKEFCDYVQTEIFTPETIVIGYNSVRFDDEFMRYTFWRNFYDPYQWEWKDGRGRWDLLDVVRMTRALRPGGIVWPMQKKKDALVPVNRLEYLTKLNGIEHEHAHDALADVFGLIGVTRLLKTHQPKIFQYLFSVRDKNHVTGLINLQNPQPFVYSSGRYENEFNKTTVAYPLCPGQNGNIIVYDLRYNLEDILEKAKSDSEFSFYPIIKELAPNKCPAVAPLGVLEEKTECETYQVIGEDETVKSGDSLTTGWEKIGLTKEMVEKNLKILQSHPEFVNTIKNRPKKTYDSPTEIEGALYDGFLSDRDQTICEAVRNAGADKLTNFHPKFADKRLPELLIHYKAKNYPDSLTDSEKEDYKKYRFARLNRQSSNFLKELEELDKSPEKDKYIIDELKLWYQNLQDGDY